jgi:hypothetical protein
VKFQKDPLFGVNLTFFASWLSWQGPAFLNFFNLSKAATHYGGYSQILLNLVGISMPCYVVPLRADIFKMAAFAMETNKGGLIFFFFDSFHQTS